MSLRNLIIFGIIVGVGLIFQRVALPKDEGAPSFTTVFYKYKQIVDQKSKPIINRLKAFVPIQESSNKQTAPKGFKSSLFLDTLISPPLIRYTANGNEARLFGLNYKLPNTADQIKSDLASFKEIGVNLVRISLTEKDAAFEKDPELLHFFLAQASTNNIFVNLAFVNPEARIATWLNLKDKVGMSLREYKSIGLIEIPSFTFPNQTNEIEKVLREAKMHYEAYVETIRAIGLDTLIVSPMPNVSGPHADQFLNLFAQSPIQVVSFAQNFNSTDDLNLNNFEKQEWLKRKAKAVHSLTWKPDYGEAFVIPAMAQKWRKMGVQAAAFLPAQTATEIPQYTALSPQKMLSFKAASRAFQLTEQDETSAELINNDIAQGPWSAATKNGNAMIFRDETSLLFAGASSEWQPFKDLPHEESLLEIACVGDCPYWRATFSSLDSSNHPGLITFRRGLPEGGKPTYYLKVHSWINTRGPASVLSDGWVVLSLKPVFPGFRELSKKIVERKNPVTKQWELYKINNQDYSRVGTKNRATGLPYIIIQSGAEYRIK